MTAAAKQDPGAGRTAESGADSEPAVARRIPWTAWPFIGLIWAYRLTLAPLLGGHCRFWPTCSEYGLEAYREHGAIRGTLLTIRRLSRCHPWGGHGVDPVPPAGRADNRDK